jgi:hypothetical protein
MGIADPARVPDFLAGNQPVGLPPKPDLHEVAKQPAIGDDAVLAWQRAGHERGLHSACDGRNDSGQRAHGPSSRQRTDIWRIGSDMAWRQASDKEDERRMHVPHFCRRDAELRLTQSKHKSKIKKRLCASVP